MTAGGGGAGDWGRPLPILLLPGAGLRPAVAAWSLWSRALSANARLLSASALALPGAPPR